MTPNKLEIGLRFEDHHSSLSLYDAGKFCQNAHPNKPDFKLSQSLRYLDFVISAWDLLYLAVVNYSLNLGYFLLYFSF